jgi:hypothetical protein
VGGIALIALGVACWPGTPLVGMLTYNAAVTLYLVSVGVASGSTGMLLWPAVVLHAILTALLMRASTTDKVPKHRSNWRRTHRSSGRRLREDELRRHHSRGVREGVDLTSRVGRIDQDADRREHRRGRSTAVRAVMRKANGSAGLPA